METSSRMSSSRITIEGVKAFAPLSHSPYGMVGSEYSTRSLAVYKVLQEAIPLALKEVQSTVLEKGSVFTIVDYGTADGGTSMNLIYACVESIREKHGDEVPINVIYDDYAVNDFTALFLRTQGLASGPRSFILDFPNVFVLASGTNFYDQCFPSNSVTFGFSATSVHWLRDKPCDITGATYCQLSTVLPEEKEKFRSQAEKDWQLYLMKRAAELMPGGRMVSVQLAVDEHGQYTGTTKYFTYGNHELLSKLWKSLLNDGIITKEEFTKTNFNCYFRTKEEFEKPFKCSDSPVVKAGLDLVSIETKIVRCPYNEKWMREKGDAKQHAKDYVEAIRAWNNSVFLSGLSDSRSSEEKTKIVDEMYHRYEAEVAKSPKDYGVDYVYTYIVIRKRR